MIYDDRVEIPDLCPIYFRDYNEKVFFKDQDDYMPKFIAPTQFMCWISADMYSAGNITLRTVLEDRNIDIILTKSFIGNGDGRYYLCRCEIPLPELAAPPMDLPQQGKFEIWQGDTLFADTIVYEFNPSYQGDIKVISYTHYENDYNTVFLQNNIQYTYTLCVEGAFDKNNFSIQSEVQEFNAQDMVNKTVYGFPMEVETLIVGDAKGIPNWLAHKVNSLSLLDTITISEDRYTKAKGSSLDMKNSLGGLGVYEMKLQLKEVNTKVFDNAFNYTFE